ncbi:MAG TPA: tripartite tricarboxylate transporter substrate binding protein, partial [Alcaligenes faecalis]|nr:tripartite tricarboxylate transporter substrate binding protein [Alcaligenes faecalis]
MNRRMILNAIGAGMLARLGGAVSLLGSAFVTAPARARQLDNVPSGPVRIVVTVNPGGNSDRIARMLAQSLAELWQQTVIVDNV